MGLKSNLHNLKEKYKGTKMAPAFNAIHTFCIYQMKPLTAVHTLKQPMI